MHRCHNSAVSGWSRVTALQNEDVMLVLCQWPGNTEEHKTFTLHCITHSCSLHCPTCRLLAAETIALQPLTIATLQLAYLARTANAILIPRFRRHSRTPMEASFKRRVLQAQRGYPLTGIASPCDDPWNDSGSTETLCMTRFQLVSVGC